MGTRSEKTVGTGWKERKEGAECAMGRESTFLELLFLCL
jgi:hypothetical protein